MKMLSRGIAVLGLAFAIGTPMYVIAGSSADSTKASGPTSVAKDDIEFLGKVAQADMTEAQAATIASSRALTADTKLLATRVATDHQVKGDDLRALAATKGVALPTQLDSKHQSQLDDLSKVDAKKFDAAYAELMTKVHKDSVSLFEKASKKSKDADIRTFAQNTLPTLQQHLDMAKRISDKS